jgi:hypothetical protein
MSLLGSLRELQSEIDERLRKLPNRLNEYGFDPFGLSPEWVRNTVLPACSCTATTSASRPSTSTRCRRAACS